MVIPWVGFPLRKVLNLVGPLPTATFVHFQSGVFRSGGIEPGVVRTSLPALWGSRPNGEAFVIANPHRHASEFKLCYRRSSRPAASARHRGPIQKGSRLRRREPVVTFPSCYCYRDVLPLIMFVRTRTQAMHDLSFVSMGIYNSTLPPQNGAPIRLNARAFAACPCGCPPVMLFIATMLCSL